MFGFGKKKLNLVDTSKIIATSLISQERVNYGSIAEIASTYNELEVEYVNTELFTLRIIALQFAFAYLAFKYRYKIPSQELGHRVAYGARLAFEELGYNEKHIEFMAEKNIKDAEYITEDIAKLNIFDKSVFITVIAQSFTERFLTSLEILDELKKTSFFICATSVVAMVFDVVEDFIKQIKVVEFR